MFLTGVLLSRFLGVEGRGRFAGHFAAIGISFTSGGLGLGYGAAFVAARSGGAAAAGRRLQGPAAASLLLTAFLLLALELFVVRAGSIGETVWALAGALLTQGASIVLGWIQGARGLRRWNTWRLLQNGGYFLGVLTLASLGGLTVTTALACYAATQGLGVAALLGPPARSPAAPDGDPAGASPSEIWRFSRGVAVSSALYQLSQRLDQLLLAMFGRAADLGIYASAVTLAGISSPLAAGLAQATYGEGLHMDPAQRVRVARKRIALALGGAGACAVVLSSIPGTLMGVAYGPEFVRGAGPLVLLAWGAVFLAGNHVAADALRASGDSGGPMRADITAAVLTIVALPVAIPRFGILGAAAVSAFAYLVTFLLNVLRATRHGGAASGAARPEGA
jgi:O-antigen/teichoic acid export membrane protein